MHCQFPKPLLPRFEEQPTRERHELSTNVLCACRVRSRTEWRVTFTGKDSAVRKPDTNRRRIMDAFIGSWLRAANDRDPRQKTPYPVVRYRLGPERIRIGGTPHQERRGAKCQRKFG